MTPIRLDQLSCLVFTMPPLFSRILSSVMLCIWSSLFKISARAFILFALRMKTANGNLQLALLTNNYTSEDKGLPFVCSHTYKQKPLTLRILNLNKGNKKKRLPMWQPNLPDIIAKRPSVRFWESSITICLHGTS